MKLMGIGVDIVELERIRDARYIHRLAEFFLLPEELALMKESRDQVQFIASRFAVKEALIKAFPGELTYHDVVLTKEGSQPVARFVRPEHISYSAHVSLSHERDYAIGFATICQ